MKISALISVVAAGCYVCDALEERNFLFAETDSLFQQLQFYMQNSGNDFELADKIVNYGCWCQLRNEQAEGIVAGYGTPVDHLDEACKAWHQCRACTTIDFSTEESCIPNDVAYDIEFDVTTMRIDCQFNPDECSVKNCICDEQLAFDLNRLINESSDDFFTFADGSGFDHASECHAPVSTTDGGNGGSGSDEPQCCGTYPNRFEFMSHNGVTKCCGDKTYNSNKHCCWEGNLGSIGTCPAM